MDVDVDVDVDVAVDTDVKVDWEVQGLRLIRTAKKEKRERKNSRPATRSAAGHPHCPVNSFHFHFRFVVSHCVVRSFYFVLFCFALFLGSHFNGIKRNDIDR